MWTSLQLPDERCVDQAAAKREAEESARAREREERLRQEAERAAREAQEVSVQMAPLRFLFQFCHDCACVMSQEAARQEAQSKSQAADVSPGPSGLLLGGLKDAVSCVC
jgi:hypothetical protein